MSRVRVHNFSISLDGFATGEGQSLETPFGHAGQRLHAWMMATRYARREIFGESGGTEGLDDAMAERQRRYGEQYPIDEDFLAALAVMPPASGIALGFDRLVMLASGAERIEQVIWTPVVEL